MDLTIIISQRTDGRIQAYLSSDGVAAVLESQSQVFEKQQDFGEEVARVNQIQRFFAEMAGMAADRFFPEIGDRLTDEQTPRIIAPGE